MKIRRWNSKINLVLAFFIASLLAYPGGMGKGETGAFYRKPL